MDPADRWIQAQSANHIKTSVVAAVDCLQDVGDQLARGRPFLIDILQDGGILYGTEGHALAEPKPLTADARREEAQANFDQWLSKARRRYRRTQFAVDEEFNEEAAFERHQSVEDLCHSLLLR